MSETTAPTLVFRLAFRTEGDFVNAYFAPPGTMDGAVLVCSMRRQLLKEDDVLWEDWRTLVRLAFDRQMERLGVPGPHEWTETPGPDHELTKPGKQ